MKKRSLRERSLLLYRSRKAILRKVRQQRRRRNGTYSGAERRYKNIPLRIGSREIKAAGIPDRLPSIFSLEDNSNEVIEFISRLRKRAFKDRSPTCPRTISPKRRWIGVYGDFTSIKKISTAAALVLASEYFRLQSKKLGRSGKPPGLVEFHKWDLGVRATLDQLGFLELLGIADETDSAAAEPLDRHVQKFISGNRLDSVDAETLRDAVWELAHGLNATSNLKTAIYDGLCEAMTNTNEHAYGAPDPQGYPRLDGQWWMTGSVSRNGSDLDVVFFDQGISIPRSLPKGHLWEHVKGLLVGSAKNDAMMIQIAVEHPRSATGMSHRGKGLQQIRGVVDHAPRGRIRILSRRGRYIYTKGEGVQMGVLSEDLGGTLIHWQLGLGA